MLNRYIENKLLRNILEWAISIVFIIVISSFIRGFVIKIANVNSTSMEPTFRHGDRILINRFIYRFTDHKLGDIIVFPYNGTPKQYFVKRIIGLPGDVVDIADYRITVNGMTIEDEFSLEPVYARGNAEFPLVVPNDSFFVLGDNRDVSMDSRYMEVGCIPKHMIVGKVFMRVWPLSNINLY